MKKSKQAELFARLEAFLKNPVKIKDGYERSDATPSDVNELESILHLLIALKWEPSYADDVPVEFILNNRSTHEPLYYLPIPYDEDQNNFEAQMLSANRNVKLAADTLDRIWRTQEYRLSKARVKLKLPK